MRKAGDYLTEFASQGQVPARRGNKYTADYDGGYNRDTFENNKRTMQYSAQNDVAQEKYKDTSSIAQNTIDRAEKNRYINTEALDKRVNEREMYNRAQGTVMFSEIFGDLMGQNSPDWKSAEPGKDVEQPDFEEMYDKYNPMK